MVTIHCCTTCKIFDGKLWTIFKVIANNIWLTSCGHGVITGRMSRSGKLPVLNLLTGQKSGFSPRRGDSLHRFTSNLVYGRRAHGSAWLCRISPQSPQWSGNAGPKYQKFPLFGKESPRMGDSLDRFLIFRGFYASNYPTSVNQIWHDSLCRLLSCCWETARRSIRPNFSVHPVGKTALDRKMNGSICDGHDELCHHAKFGEDRTTRAGCNKCENMVFVCFLLL